MEAKIRGRSGSTRDSQAQTDSHSLELKSDKAESKIDKHLVQVQANEQKNDVEHVDAKKSFDVEDEPEASFSKTDGTERKEKDDTKIADKSPSTVHATSPNPFDDENVFEKLNISSSNYNENQGEEVMRNTAGEHNNTDADEDKDESPFAEHGNKESGQAEIKVVQGVLVDSRSEHQTQNEDNNKGPSTNTSTNHRIKRFKFFNRQISICLQNENGPCPLLALANVLILRGAIKIHPDRSEISSDLLIELIAGHLLETNPPLAEDDAYSKNQQKTLADIIDVLPTLQFGLDVNVQFGGVKNFEYDTRIAVFDMLDISLYHGWIVDPNDEITYSVLYKKSYNQIVDKIIEGQQLEADIKSKKPQTVLGEPARLKREQVLREAFIAQQFLSDTASQLTYVGLTELHSVVKERQTCVFFRNNHFCTMFKFEGQLYLLLTDQGYAQQDAVAWERLNEIDGNTDICSPTFSDPNEYIAQSLDETTDDTAEIVPSSDSPNSGSVDQDRILAMQLQQQELQHREGELVSNQAQSQATPPENPLGLERIDVEEQKREMEAIQRRRRNGNHELNSNSRSPANENTNRGCIIT